jgi:hypothetical protein
MLLQVLSVLQSSGLKEVSSLTATALRFLLAPIFALMDMFSRNAEIF